MPVPVNKMILDTFYFLKKEYGTTIQLTKVGKGEVDLDTGVQTPNHTTYGISAVFAPVGLTTEFLLKLLGRVEKIESVFLIRLADLPAGLSVEPTDFFVHGNLKYQSLEIEDFAGVVLALTGKTHK